MQLMNRSAYVRLAAVVLAALSLGTLVGCGVAASKPSTNYVAPNQLTGLVLAGRNYMANATVKIYETQPSGVATNGTYVGQAKLLQTLTASNTGVWSTTGISCSSPDQLYVTAEAGTPYPYVTNTTTLSNNPNSLMMTAIGDCSILGNGENPSNLTSIITNEASTVAAVWALRPFISLSGTTVNVTSSATNYGGTNGIGTTTNFAGMAHAFLNANNLSPYHYGAFVAFTNGAVDATGGGLVPTQLLNTLAYIQYLCTIGTPDGTTAGNFSLCTQLYGMTTPTGGTPPTNSLQAMLNIANNPSANSAALMTFAQTPIPQEALPESTAVGPFVPELAEFDSAQTGAVTNDFSVAIYYGPGYGGNGTTAQPSTVPIYVSLNANDDVFFANSAASSSSTQGNVIALTSNGQNLWASPNDLNVDTQPRELAPDQFGNIWVASGGTDAGENAVMQLSAATGATLHVYPASNTTLYGIAVDSLGNVWYTDNVTTGQGLHELVKSGTTYAEANLMPAPISGTQMLQVRPDSKNNIWVAGYAATGKGTLQYFPNTGTPTVPTYTAGLISTSIPSTGSAPYGVAVDASGNAYTINSTTTAARAGFGQLYYTTVTNTGGTPTLNTSFVINAPETDAGDTFAGRFMDTAGDGSIWFIDASTGSSIYTYNPSSTALSYFYPCYNAGPLSAAPETCGTGISTRIDMALDSTGSLWVASYGNEGGGRMTQVIGIAAPTVPLKALGKIGVMP